MKSGTLIGLTAVLLVSTVAARADVSINNKPTANMSCDAGVCTATAQKAVLNVSDLATMLASGDVAVKTALIAKDIDIDQPLQWTSTARLTLDAQQSVTINKQTTVAGQGALTVTTNDTGQPKNKSKTGEFIIVPEHGSVQFWDLGSSLNIDGNSYTLVGDIKTLASDIAANPSGFYALAKPYDASADGTYVGAPIGMTLTGTFDGLGNAISNLVIEIPANGSGGALISWIGATGKVGDVGVLNVDLHVNTCCGSIGGVAALVSRNDGLIADSWATGSIHIRGGGGGDAAAAGLASVNRGRIGDSFARLKVQMRANNSEAGGLVAENFGAISRSYAAGSVKGDRDDTAGDIGGLVGYNNGTISDTYATTSVYQAHECCHGLGGLIGMNDQSGQIASSYASGAIHLSDEGFGSPGGLIGDDLSAAGDLKETYWNLDDGISDPGQGAGNIANDPGITGLTTQQLQSGLPAGFDPKVWTQSPNQNHGLPYLRSLPTK